VGSSIDCGLQSMKLCNLVLGESAGSEFDSSRVCQKADSSLFVD